MRREKRFAAVKENDIWEYRKEAPKDWNRPLPQWFIEQNKNSFLSEKQKEREANRKQNSD